MTLLQTIRNPHSTSQELGDALRRHLAACRRPRKPLGDGDMLVIDQRGSMEMWTRERWDAEVYRQDTKKKRCRDCHTKPCQVRGRVYRPAGPEAYVFLKNQMSVAQDSDMEWLDQFAARQQEEADGDRYTGEWWSSTQRM